MNKTDAEIEKALECCSNWQSDKSCEECPENTYGFGCAQKMAKHALDYINRLKAENERLNKEVDRLSQCVMYHDGQIADAIKEFAERLKKEFKPEINYGVVANCAIKLFRNTIDYLLKEMTEKE